MTVEPYGTSDNDAVYTIATVAATVLTLVDDDAVTAEGPVSCQLTASWTDTDGWPEYPGPDTRGTDLVRANGFDDGFSIVTIQDLDFETLITINASAADSVAGVDDYDWWLSDRTEVPASRFLSLAQAPDTGGNSFSGSVNLSLTATCITELALALPGSITMQQLASMFKFAHLYVRRRSDGAIQWVDLHALYLAELETI
jgi:hypothetical protein